ncbi:MAG TPA: DUF1292 domain-containing protein [Bacillota bacterium]|nr:DUF1292 domain-containing protein [Bacillota bacterium]
MDSNEERMDFITLVDEEGNEHEFVVVDLFPVAEKQYAILVPVRYDAEASDEEPDFDDEAYIFRVDLDAQSGEETLVEVEDEAEWNRVAQEWENRVKELGPEEDDEDIL